MSYQVEDEEVSLCYNNNICDTLKRVAQDANLT